jgi:hypothetical protein
MRCKRLEPDRSEHPVWIMWLCCLLSPLTSSSGIQGTQVDCLESYFAHNPQRKR